MMNGLDVQKHFVDAVLEARHTPKCLSPNIHSKVMRPPDWLMHMRI